MVGRDSALSSLVSAANAYEMLFSRRASPSKLTMLSIADRIFINEDLTGRRATLARSTRTLNKYNKIADCWTANGNVMVKDLTNQIQQVRSDTDLAIYK